MEYIHYDLQGNQSSVRCKGACLTIIMVGNQPTPAYCELVIAMRDPNNVLSKHETGVCKSCKVRILNGGLAFNELEAIYTQDVEQWLKTAIRTGTPQAEALDMATKLAARTPLKPLNELGRGEVAA